MSRRVLGIRRGNSVQERIQNPVQDLAQLRLIPTTDVVDKAIIVVEDNGMFRYDYEGGGMDDGSTIIAPDVGPGRWFFLAGSGAITLQDVERARAVFPVVGGTDQTYTDWVEDDVTIVRIDVLLLSALTVAGTYEMTITGAGNNLLSLPLIDITALTPGTITTLALTGTALDLQLVDLDKIEINVVSDDINLVGGDALIIHIYYERTGGGGGGGGGGEDLATTLAIDNFTGGTNIQVDDGDAIVGEAAAVASGDPGFDLVLRGGQGDGAGIQGPVRIEPIADVEKAVAFDQSNFSNYFGLGSYAPGAGRGLIYIDDGDLANQLQGDTPYFVDELGSPINMLGGWVETGAVPGGISNLALARGVIGFVGPVTAAGAALITLPDSNTNRGRVVWIEHTGDGTGSVTVGTSGGDTLDGGVGTVSVTFGQFRAFIADGYGDWRTIELGGAGGGVTGPGAVTAVNQVALWTDGTGTAIKQSTMTVVGDDANVVGTLSAAEVVAGDLVMRSEERNAAWRMIEHHGHIEVVNEKTGQRFKLALIPLEDG